jgi:hypothetical protein
MKPHVFFLILFSVLSVLFIGCASIVRGDSEKLMIQSNPSGAQVRLSTGQFATTPFEFEVKRKGTIFVSISKDGYKTVETAVISSIDGASLGVGTVANFIFLPVINDVVDYKTGANYSHKPNPLIVTLIPLSSEEEYKYTPPPSTDADLESEATTELTQPAVSGAPL